MGQRRSKRRTVQFQGIAGGVASGPIPGWVAASCPTPVGSKQRWCDSKSFVYTRVAWWTAYTRSNQDFVYTRSLPDSVYTRSLPRFFLYQVTSKILFIPGGVLLFTPASVGRRVLGRPIHACRAIATAFAGRPSRSASPGQTGITNFHNCRRLGLAS